MELMLHIIPKREAKRIGMSRYFTGTNCLNGHLSERLVSNAQCIKCANDRTAAYRAKNAETMRERYRDYHQRNKETRNEQNCRYRQDNPERWREINRASKAKRKQKIAAYMADYRQRNRDHIENGNKAYRQRFGALMNARTQQWRKQNRDAYLASKAARRAAEMRATPPWADMEAIKEVYREAERLEIETGIPHHVDHGIPLRHPLVCGLHVHFNLQPLPANDNMRKSNLFEVS